MEVVRIEGWRSQQPKEVVDREGWVSCLYKSVDLLIVGTHNSSIGGCGG